MPDSASYSPPQLPSTLASYVILSLPVVAAEILSAVQGVLLIPLIIYGEHFGLSAFTFSGILSGFATLFIGFYSDFNHYLQPRFLLLGTEFLFAIGLILTLIVSHRLQTNYFIGESAQRLPYGYLIPGMTFIQLAINGLQLCGRSLLTKHLHDNQPQAHKWAATLMLGCSFVVKLVFGLSAPVDAPELSPTVVKAISLSFGSFALLLVTVAIVQIPKPTYSGPGALMALFGTETLSDFFKLVLPLLVGQIGWAAVELAAPALGAAAGEADGSIDTAIDGLGTAYIGVACGALVGIGGAWLQDWPHLKTRATFILSLLVAGVATGLIVFVPEPPTAATAAVLAAFAGVASGPLASVGWAVVTKEIPPDAIGKYIGLTIGLTGALRGIVIYISFAGADVFVPAVFIVAAMLGLGHSRYQ